MALKRDNIQPISKVDRFGKFYGIVLMILAFIDFQSDPAFLTIILSAGIIAGCIFCFSKRYKLKGFTIVALVLAIICLLCGIGQAKKIGLFKIPGNDSIISEDVVETTPIIDNESEDNKIEITKDETIVEESVGDNTETEAESPEEDITVAEKETVNGVDPELKAFLDSYEAFMDEYVDFMKKYMNDPGNAVAMLTEYTEILSKYEEFAKKVDEYDSDEMSTEDAKYYLEVVNRCNQKMLDIY